MWINLVQIIPLANHISLYAILKNMNSKVSILIPLISSESRIVQVLKTLRLLSLLLVRYKCYCLTKAVNKNNLTWESSLLHRVQKHCKDIQGVRKVRWVERKKNTRISALCRLHIKGRWSSKWKSTTACMNYLTLHPVLLFLNCLSTIAKRTTSTFSFILGFEKDGVKLPTFL